MNELGESVVFSNRPPFILQNIEGLGDVDVNVQMQKAPYQDGETHIDSLLAARPIRLEVSIVGKNVDELRRYLSRVTNPKISGVLRYEDDSVIREIECITEHVPQYSTRNRNQQVAVIDLLAPDPYWRSPEVTTEPLAAFLPRFRFPFRFPIVFGERGSQATLYNDGDVPCPIEIEFNGPAQLPIVRNVTTGEFIRVEKSLNAGEKLIINTSHGRERKVIIDKGNGEIENAFHYIDIWESTLFQLAVGENVIEYDAVASGGQAVVQISYRKLYVGEIGRASCRERV